MSGCIEKSTKIFHKDADFQKAKIKNILQSLGLDRYIFCLN